jgi:hypothetical protein
VLGFLVKIFFPLQELVRKRKGMDRSEEGMSEREEHDTRHIVHHHISALW